MMELHVWGCDNTISLIEPECLAAVLLLQSSGKDFKVVASNNTNLSPTHNLPLLIDVEAATLSDTDTNTEHSAVNKISGYSSIYKYISSSLATSPSPTYLVDYSLACYIIEKLKPINQYNLYIKKENYENYTRKLFKDYFPFPMMYNQPLKFYYKAQDIANSVGLLSQQGFFGSGYVAETETVNEDTTSNEVAISSLHEKELIKKSTQKKVLADARYSLKCLHLISEYLNEILNVYKNQGFSVGDGNLAGADFILTSYLHSLTSDILPDTFINTYVTENYNDLMTEHLKLQLKTKQIILMTSIEHAPEAQIPSLWNEIVYITSPIFKH